MAVHAKRWRQIAVKLARVAVVAVGALVAQACLPDEYTDAELAIYCNSPDDCASLVGFACWEATCVNHQCQTNNKPRAAGDSCWTPKCENDCVCTPAASPVGAGKCLPPK